MPVVSVSQVTAAPVPCLFSSAHWSLAPSTMRRLFKIELSCALSRALTKLGIAIAANNPMMATTIMISTSVKPAFLFVLICIFTDLSVCLFVRTRGVNIAKGGFYDYFISFTHCLLQPRSVRIASGMPESTAIILQEFVSEELSWQQLCPILCHFRFSMSRFWQRRITLSRA